jgi:hypothetical protein
MSEEQLSYDDKKYLEEDHIKKEDAETRTAANVPKKKL